MNSNTFYVLSMVLCLTGGIVTGIKLSPKCPPQPKPCICLPKHHVEPEPCITINPTYPEKGDTHDSKEDETSNEQTNREDVSEGTTGTFQRSFDSFNETNEPRPSHEKEGVDEEETKTVGDYYNQVENHYEEN